MAPPKLALDWLLVISCAFSVIITVVYLFYLNRILALIVGYLIRLNWWIEGSDKAWVSLESFQVSLLAGRIMIKDLRYHSSNQSFKAIKCRITWRYWIWRTRDEFKGEPGEESTGSSKLPCRIHVSFEGVEWLLYNRTAAYNDVLSHLHRQSAGETDFMNGHGSQGRTHGNDHVLSSVGGGDAPSRKSTTAYTENSDPGYRYPPFSLAHSLSPRTYLARIKGVFVSWFSEFKPNFHEVLPIGVSALHGAIVCGNSSTPSLLVARFSSASGSYGIATSRSSHDKYKVVIEGGFQNVKFELEKNVRYRGSLVQHGRAVSRNLGSEPLETRLSYSAFTHLWTDRKRRETHYKTEDTHARAQATHESVLNDYAIVETILEAPKLELAYYWDEPGVVPPAHQKVNLEGLESYDVGNGDLAPQSGIDLILYEGTIRYGPWADRQRAELQRLFFPPAYQDSEPTTTLHPGDTRIYTSFKVFVELRQTTTFHVPFKEPSKDWQFDEIRFPGSARRRREAGWIEVHVGNNSTISYLLPWVATESGYNALLELHLDNINTLSSVNDIHILNAESSHVSCQLPAPLRWNDLRRWTFNIEFQKPVLYLIRDHINLFTDLGKDWTSGPPGDYDRWIPMHYMICMSLKDFELNMFLNDHNIITHPHARDANTLLTMRGPSLRNRVDIPSTVFRPSYTAIPFWIEVPDVNLSLTLPKWNTHATFATSRITDFGRIGFLRIDASFLYYSDTQPQHIDQLRLDILTRDVVFISFGWVIRHLMSIRDNYFGNFTHFSTLSEYVAKRQRNLPVGDPVEWKWREGKSNVFEVSLNVDVEDAVVIMPAGFFGYEHALDPPLAHIQSHTPESKSLGTCAIIFQPELQVQLRTHDYSMEMSLNISPITATVVENLMHNLVYGTYRRPGRQMLQIDGISIVANRLFGPQPRTSTYLCLWEFQVGAITGILSTTELRGLTTAINSLRYNFRDDANAPASEFAIPSDPDVTFLKVTLQSIDIAWMADQTSINLSLPLGLGLDFNDLAGKNYKKVTELRVPQGVVRALVSSATRPESWLEAGSVAFDVGVDVLSAPRGWREAAKAQVAYVATQDTPTRRAWFLYEASSKRCGSAYCFSMFLPRPKLPKWSSQGTLPLDSITHRSSLKERIPSVFESIRSTNSDEEDHISEADRDARLAHSRPTTPLLLNTDYENRNMSSSDESDNDDITSDISDSDSDVLDNDDASLPPLAHYRNVVRRFELHHPDKSTFSSTLFSRTRDSAISLGSPSSKAVRSSDSRVNAEMTVPLHDEATNSTMLLLRCKSVDLVTTPLCLPVVRRVTDELFDTNTSLELLVDNLTMTYIGNTTLENSPTASQNNLDVEVPVLRLRILQSLMAVDEAVATFSPVPRPSNAPPLSPENSRIVSDTVVSLHDLGTTIYQSTYPSDSISTSKVIFRMTFAQFTAQLDTVILHALPQMNRTRTITPQCTFVMNESRAAYSAGNFRVKLGDVRVQSFGKASPEMAVATVDSATMVIRECLATYGKRNAQVTGTRRYLLANVLQQCRGLRVSDPLTQTQPSFLIQSGRPLRLRSDVSWKLFIYLRFCLRHLDISQRTGFQARDTTGAASFTPMEIHTLLAQQLSEWGHELDLEQMGRLPFVRHCFSSRKPSVEKETGAQKNLHFSTLSFHSGTLYLIVFEGPLGSDDGSANAFVVGPFYVGYRHRTQKTTHLMRTGQELSPALIQSGPDVFKVTRRHLLTIVLEDVRLKIYPTFIIFLQHLLHLHGRYFRSRVYKKPELPTPPHEGPIPENHWECFIKTRRVSVQAGVESMVIEMGFTDASLAMPCLQTAVPSRTKPGSRIDLSGNCSLKLSQIYMHVREAHDKVSSAQTNGRDILAGLQFSSLVIDTSYSMIGEHPLTIRGVLTMGNMLLSVPRSALLTYRLVEEWRTQYLPNVHAMTQDLITELGKRQESPSLGRPHQLDIHSSFLLLDFQVSAKRVGISLQVMHGTWLSWDVYNVMVLLRNSAAVRRNRRFAFGVQLASQLIQIGAQSNYRESTTVKAIKLALPAFRIFGNFDGTHLRSHAIIDYFSLTLKPKYMDDILLVQQNLGTHFYDMLDLVAENRKMRPTSKKNASTIIKYNIAFMLQGFRVGIEGPTTTLDLTSAQMTGTAQNETRIAWDFTVSSLALALSHHSTGLRPKTGFDRTLRSAYMVLDLKASSSLAPTPSGDSSSQNLRLWISRMHAVMSPNSIGELGDLIDHVQAEKLQRQEQRAIELEEIKNKTKRVMSAFEMRKPATSLTRSSSFLDKRTILISIADIGIAFPLALRDEIEVDTIGSVPAFLMSIKTATFSIKRSESGQASMGRLSFQFVQGFNQSHPSQFDADQHHSRNRLLYPGMKAEFQSKTSSVMRQWQIGAHVAGFVLDLDPSIVDRIFGLVDVYHKGRERVDRLKTIPDANKLVSEGGIASVEASYLAIPTSSILATLVFHTGKLRVRNVQESYGMESRSMGPSELDESLGKPVDVDNDDDTGADVINFPTVTVWSEYRATPAVSKISAPQDQESPILIFRSQVHSTINEITPSLFPFLAGFVRRVEERLRHSNATSPTPSEASDISIQNNRDFLASKVLGGIQLSFSLRIDSSRLELACGHRLGVVAALHWENGGFLVTLSPRARVAHFAGSVTGLEVDLRHLKHQGGMVRTAKVDARNLALSVSYAQTDRTEGTPSHSISVVVDTEFGASLRLDRLQDILIFKAVYMDRLPGVVPQSPARASPAEKFPESRLQGLTTLILFRARRIKLMVDLGHNIASAIADLETLVLQSRITKSLTDLSLSIAQTNLNLEDDRPLSGYMHLPEFSFTTARRNDVQLGIKNGISRMLDVTLTSGILDVVLQSERRTLLQYHAKPFDIRIADDWAAIDWNLPPEERTLRLDFSVIGTEVLAIANLQTIPKIIILLAKLKTDLQEQQAEARNSLASSSITQIPKPDNALSEVADAMIRSARSRLADGPVFSYIISQHMKLWLSSLRLALFKNPNDLEMALFHGQDVHAELQRIVQALDMPPSRVLKLAFSSLHLSKYTSLKYKAAGNELLAPSWLDRLLKGATQSTIARVPAMNLEMNSDVEFDGQQEVLQYDLVAMTDEQAQTSRSIYVSLNLSLYIWAGAMVKGLGAEVEKALLTSGLNKPTARAAAAALASPPTLAGSAVDQTEHSGVLSETRMTTPSTPFHPVSVPVSPRPAASNASPTSAILPNVFDSNARPARKYHARSETAIDYGTIEQLGEATPDAKAPWLGLKETVPPRVHEYATLPMEVLMKMLLGVYSKQLKIATRRGPGVDIGQDVGQDAGGDVKGGGNDG